MEPTNSWFLVRLVSAEPQQELQQLQNFEDTLELWHFISFVSIHMTVNSYLFFIFCFLGLHPAHMEIPRLEGESELQLPVYTKP